MTVWMIDDSPAEQALLRVVLTPHLDGRELVGLFSAEEAVTRLKAGEQPSLILLDLNMPGMGGHMFLEHCAEYFPLTIPVIVLSSSNNPADVERAYWAGANSYLNKPSDLDGLKLFAKSLADYWFKAARLPPTSNSKPA